VCLVESGRVWSSLVESSHGVRMEGPHVGVEPSLGDERFLPSQQSGETQALTLHWTLGINKDVVGGVHNLSDANSTDMFYAAAHTGVIFDYNTGVQRLLQGHVNPITATAVSKDKKMDCHCRHGP